MNQDDMDELKKKSLVLKILKKAISQLPLTKIRRPKDIPIIVPDCGWNHGETSKEEK